jgi:hypothetical protein
VFKEDSVLIPTQKSWILCFRPDGPEKRPDAHQSATSVGTTWQYRSDIHQCLEDTNSSRLHSSEHHDKTSGCTLEFDKKSDFLLKHRCGKTAAFVWTSGQHRPAAVLTKVIV